MKKELETGEARPKGLKIQDITNRMGQHPESPVSSRLRNNKRVLALQKSSVNCGNLSKMWATKRSIQMTVLPPSNPDCPVAKKQHQLALEEQDVVIKKRRKIPLHVEHDDPIIPAEARALHRVHSNPVFDTPVHSTSILGTGICLSSPEELVPEHYSLLTVEKPQVVHRAFRSISGETLKCIIDGMSEEQFKSKFILVDCRYRYEYEGGHIRYAMNIFDKVDLKIKNWSVRELVESVFYSQEFQDIKVPIFYCEFSQVRGPKMARELRRIDRERHGELRYPSIDYGEIYVLDYGYSRFFCDHRSFCVPEHYIPMTHAAHTHELKLYDFHLKKRGNRHVQRTLSTFSFTAQLESPLPNPKFSRE